MSALITNMLDGMAAIASGRYTVYPDYLICTVKRALVAAKANDGEQIIEIVGSIEPVRDGYAVAVTDRNGKTYRITVEVLDDDGREVRS